MDRGRTAYVHQRTLRETCTIRVLQFFYNPRIRDHQKSEHNGGIQELRSMVRGSRVTINFTRMEWRAFHSQFLYHDAQYGCYFLHIKKKCSHNSISTLLIIKISYKKNQTRVKKIIIFFEAMQIMQIMLFVLLRYVLLSTFLCSDRRSYVSLYLKK